MTYSKRIWLCGYGYYTYHFCKICNLPFDSKDEAIECEKTHGG